MCNNPDEDLCFDEPGVFLLTPRLSATATRTGRVWMRDSLFT